MLPIDLYWSHGTTRETYTYIAQDITEFT